MQLRRWPGAALLASLLGLSAPGRAQVAEVDLRTQIFHEPSAQSRMTVYTPEVNVEASPSEAVRVFASYQADAVTGASEAVKAGPLSSNIPDIVSRASVRDFRQIATGGVALTREHTRVSASYTYGTENDYRSNSFSVSAGTDFLQRNTDVEIGYSKGFDDVCSLRQQNLPTTLRLGLDSSDGCFTSSERTESLPISLDNFRVGWTQTWTPVFTTQLIFTGALQHGFLGNPYREVVISSAGERAQENHPDDRRRAALGLGLKYYSRNLETAFGMTARGYRDSWELQSFTAELTAERYLQPWLRLFVHGRAYAQSGASFWSDDYTGGEPETGPRGQFWSGDREMSPLQTLLAGMTLTGNWRAAGDARWVGVFRELSAGVSMDLLATFLEDFTWAGVKPDDTVVLLPSLAATGSF
ncbi:MAG TPA: DUF3570 domain-containing protein [Polyangiaceae bacterium]|nr:DUF3570 domain-containing protein [Polyangiaceae bacterium]